MSGIKRITLRATLMMIVCVCLGLPLISTAQQQADKPASDSARLSPAYDQPDATTDSPAYSYFSQGQGEPLLLLLSGVVILIGATTLKKAANRKKSSSR